MDRFIAVEMHATIHFVPGGCEGQGRRGVIYFDIVLEREVYTLLAVMSAAAALEDKTNA